ncbi:MAG: hypothetical protein V1735_08025 [Nanoarchaeota archaeon]
MALDESQHGSVVRVTIESVTEGHFYRYRGRVMTGPAAGDGLLVGCRSKITPPREVAVCIGAPLRTGYEFTSDDLSVGYFLTSKPPASLDYFQAGTAFFWGEWDASMNPGYENPNLMRVVSYYNPGPLGKALYITAQGYDHSSIFLFWHNESIKAVHEDKSARGPKSAINQYLKKVKRENPNEPRLIVLDKKVDLERILRIFDMSDMRYLKMEPQQSER